MKEEQEIYNKAAECRIFLRVHGFLPDSENEKIWTRIDKYGTKWDVNKLKQPKLTKS